MQLWQWSLAFVSDSNVDVPCWRAVDCNPYLAPSQGIGTLGPNCSKDGMPNCSRCFEGYHLRNQKCEMKHCHSDGTLNFGFHASRIFWCLHSAQLFVSLQCCLNLKVLVAMALQLLGQIARHLRWSSAQAAIPATVSAALGVASTGLKSWLFGHLLQSFLTPHDPSKTHQDSYVRGFELQNGQCRVKKCQCDHGHAAEGIRCGNHSWSQPQRHLGIWHNKVHPIQQEHVCREISQIFEKPGWVKVLWILLAMHLFAWLYACQLLCFSVWNWQLPESWPDVLRNLGKVHQERVSLIQWDLQRESVQLSKWCPWMQAVGINLGLDALTQAWMALKAFVQANLRVVLRYWDISRGFLKWQVVVLGMLVQIQVWLCARLWHAWTREI